MASLWHVSLYGCMLASSPEGPGDEASIRWLTIYHHSDKIKLVVNYILSTSYARIINGHTASITCTGITQFCVIYCEGKVVMELVSWQHITRVWCGNGHTAIHPPITVVLPQSSRHYLTINGAWLSFMKGIGWWNWAVICFRVCYRRGSETKKR